MRLCDPSTTASPSGNRDVIAALARAGGVRVSTIAYQTHSAMLGFKLATAAPRTGDIAQFKNASVAVEDSAPPVLEKQVDKTFRAIPHTVAGRGVSYAANGGLRVDFLPHNEGREPVRPRRPAAPALQTDAVAFP